MSTPATYDAVGIGNAIVDVIARCEEEDLAALSLDKGRMKLIEEHEIAPIYGAMGPTVEVSGGSAANTLAGIASLGGKAAFIGKVANDDFGTVFRHDLTATGVHFATAAAPEPEARTARCLILVTPDGQRTMNTFLGISPHLSETEIDTAVIAASAFTYLEGYLFDREAAKRAFERAASIAQAHGRSVALSLSDVFCVDRHRDAFRRLVRDGVDLLFANQEELLALYQTSDLDKAIELVAGECRLAVVTRSAEGSVIVSGEGRISIPAGRVRKVVDTTGAGDLYAAGFIFGLGRGLPLETCGRLGSIAAAEVIGHVGARPEVPLDTLVRREGVEF